MELGLGRITHVRWDTVVVAVPVCQLQLKCFNCNVMVLGISCDNKTSAGSLSLLKFIVLLISANGTDIINN